MEKFRFEYEIEGLKHSAEVTGDALTIRETTEHFKDFLRGLYGEKLVDEILVIGPECK